VALAGVMGGADTEITTATTELLIESALFAPMSVRGTARKLALHSDSSYRFERGVDPQGVEWASRRCAELVLELAGGELAPGVVEVGKKPEPRTPISLRYGQLRRVLGIEIEPKAVEQILVALGNQKLRADAAKVEVIPPSWRADLAREIDLVEEIARIHGYDKIPEDASVPMIPSHRTRTDRVLAKVRQALNSAGFDEAMTLSAVEETWSAAFSPWTTAAPMRAVLPILRRADRLRRSLVPSLLGARQTNEAVGNATVELFEIAHVYLPRGQGQLPLEELMLALTSGQDYSAMMGVLEMLIAALNPAAALEARQTRQPLLDGQRSAELWVKTDGAGERLLGYLGQVNDQGLATFDLRLPATVAELRLATLDAIAELIPKFEPLPIYPAVSRDLNLVVDEAVLWADLARTVRAAASPHVESVTYQDTYRDPERLGPGKKSILLTLTLRSSDGTLTNEQADGIRARVVEACQRAHGAQLRA
jgi:phenylalanyl-tRNA synthetase beta chain